MMNTDELELIQAGADGELDDAGCTQLEQLLAESAEAREQHDAILRLNAFLDQVPPVQPPDALHGRIVNAVSLPAPVGRSASGLLDWLPGVVRYGLAAGLAVVVTTAVYQGRSQLDGVDYDRLVGTISERGTEVDRFDFAQPGASVSVRLFERGDIFALEFDLETEDAVRFDMDFADSGLRFDAFAQADLNLDEMSLSKTTLSARTEGAQRFVVLMRSDQSAQAAQTMTEPRIDLRLSRNGAELESGTLRTRPDD